MFDYAEAKNLAMAVVSQAIEDYARIESGRGTKQQREAEKKEIEAFFRSKYFKSLTEGRIDPEWLMKKVKELIRHGATLKYSKIRKEAEQ